MQKVHDFLKKVGTYYLATIDGNRPRVRPFGTINLFDGKLYIQTGKIKDVAKQIALNNQVEISAFDGESWIRIACTLIEDERLEAQKSMLDAYPSLQGRYAVDDGNMVVYYMSDAVATFSSFSDEPTEVKW